MKYRMNAMAAGAACLLASCCTVSSTGPRETIVVDAKVTVTEAAGGYSFKYQAPFADENGNFDFSRGKPLGKTVGLSFTITDSSIPGLKFKSPGSDAIWIAPRDVVGATGSPQGPYEGREFLNFTVSEDGRTLTLTDLNDDGVTYRYALRFDRGAETVQHDPDTKNGGNGTGG